MILFRFLKFFIKFFLKLFIGLIVCGAIVAIGGYVYYSKDLPDVTTLKEVRLQTPLQILSKEGELIATFGERRRIPLKYQDIPPLVTNAVIATEDARFYEHHGIDPLGILRAMYFTRRQYHYSASC